MRAIRSKDTKPELTVRRLVHSHGYRYRLHRAGLPGKPDLVFVSRRKVILVHGCFWHGHGCKLSHVPQSNRDYWLPKLARNVVRDRENQAALAAKGWQSLVIWECELKQLAKVRQRVARFLR